MEVQRTRDLPGELREGDPGEAGGADEKGSSGAVRVEQAATDVAIARSKTVEEVADPRAPGVAQTLAAETNTMEAGAEGADAGAVEENDAAAMNSPKYERWPATLDARWAEVEFMLCHEVDCAETLQYTTEATEAGLTFMEKLEEKAQELGVLKGQLSRWLLPFNTDTSVEEQQAATPRRLQESLLALSATNYGAGDGGTGGVLTEEEAEYLTAGARKVRQLVRLKIADDNDLNTAKEALVTMAGFFVSISEEAAKRGGNATAFSVLQERRAMSPITRPPPLPCLLRPASATSAAAAAKINEDSATAAVATKQTNARKRDHGGRGTSLAAASTTKGPAVPDSASVVSAAERAERNVIGSGRPEANARGDARGNGRSDDPPPRPADRGAAGALSKLERAAMGEMVTAATLEAESANSTVAQRDSSKEDRSSVEKATPVPAAPAPAAEAISTTSTMVTAGTPAANSSRRLGSKGLMGEPRHGRVAGTEMSRGGRDRSSRSRGSVSTTPSPARGGGDGEDVASTRPSREVQDSPRSRVGEVKGTANVAPAGSLVQLKQRRQQARTRSNSER